MSNNKRQSILVFAGSSRTASFNKKLAQLAAIRTQALGGDATFIDLADFPMPLYNGDLESEQGVPEHVRKLKSTLAEHSGLIVASPEYNGFITPLLKNTLDWLSRPEGDSSGLALFEDKPAVILSASPGGLGGIRSLALIRQLLSNLGVIVLPGQLAVARAGQAFTDDGMLVDDNDRQRLDTLCQKLIDMMVRQHR